VLFVLVSIIVIWIPLKLSSLRSSIISVCACVYIYSNSVYFLFVFFFMLIIGRILFCYFQLWWWF
jgi:hypothetical protein